MSPKLLNMIYWAITGVLTLVLMVFSSARQAQRNCNDISINVDKQFQKYFIDEEDVEALLTEGNKKIVKGLSKEALDLRYLENLLAQDPFISYARVSLDLHGNLEVYVKQNTPIARVFTRNKSFYVAQNGKHLPISTKYSARVPVVISEYDIVDKKNNFFASEEGESYLNLLNYIGQNEFWGKQVAELDFNRSGEVNLRMQVGRQIVEMGKPEEIEEKFFRLNVFTRKVLPTVGWNKYNKVSLKYKDQIVCE